MILGVQIYLTRTGSRGHHRALRAREPESTVMVETAANEEEKMISDLRPYSHYDLAMAVFNSKGEGPRSETLPFTTREGGEHDKEGKNWVWKGGGELQWNGGRDLITKWERKKWSKMDWWLMKRKWREWREKGNEEKKGETDGETDAGIDIIWQAGVEE